MFERFTEQTRRAIFFARYEASNYGSAYIETEHLLLGVLQADRELANRLAKERITADGVRGEIDKRITRRDRYSVTIEVPLSGDSKKILNLAADSAEKLGHRQVETEHLLLGILRVEKCLAAQILTVLGLKTESLEKEIAQAPAKHGRGSSARLELEAFLDGLKHQKSGDLIDYFASNAELIDISGQQRTREEIWKDFETIFAPYAKKNAGYLIESTLVESNAFYVATVLWKNALLASEERVWMHRMGVTLLREEAEWKILLLQLTAVRPPMHV